MHLIVDGYGGDRQRLSDLDFIFDLLDHYPARIGMTKIMPPYVFKYHGKVAEDWGISGFVLIAESHISIHTFPDRSHVNVDIFSCKGFATDEAIQNLKAAFGLATVECRILERGLEYPHDPARAADLVHTERRAVAQAGARSSFGE
ncbi:MAG: S-adenosylmethionine decarboxylase [Chloroflexi bacterium]|nr:S-adenosylmethionine decarboxylase [Chloroflexota bacterium]